MNKELADLPLFKAVPEPEDRRSRIQREFEEFHADNPRIYSLIVKYAREIIAVGRVHYSMDAIFERIRWHMVIETKSADEFKLNDHYTSRYARLVMEQERDLAGFFEVRTLRADKV
jgi:hypothetical protein